MTVLYSFFRLLSDDKYIFTSFDGLNSVILSQGVISFAKYFFELVSCADSDDWYNEWWNPVFESFIHMDKSLLYRGNVVIPDVDYYRILDWTVYNGHMFIMIWKIADSTSVDGDVLLVLSAKSLDYVGTISSKFGGQSSSALSLILLTIPEFHWNV